jgi:hypothetical protein
LNGRGEKVGCLILAENSHKNQMNNPEVGVARKIVVVSISTNIVVEEGSKIIVFLSFCFIYEQTAVFLAERFQTPNI